MKLACIAILAFFPVQDETRDDKAEAVRKAVEYLKGTQQEDGHWGAQYSVAITSMGGLALLSQTDKPFESKELLKAVKFIQGQIKEGKVPNQGHTWVHSQGFATLLLAEFYGRALLSEKKPDLDLDKLKETIAKCVKAIEKAQSSTGGWYYHDKAGAHDHEGSTTVCAVQALRSAANYGIEIDKDVLVRGFDYLKKTQNKDGGFQYQLGRGGSMVEGTAGAVATLALMRKLDFPVLIKGAKYLDGKTDTITKARFPFYGHFYSVLGMKIVHEEMGKAVPHAKDWHGPIFKWLVKDQHKDGYWALRGWMKQSGGEGERHDYSTALAILILSIHDERLSIFKRKAPKLPTTLKFEKEWHGEGSKIEESGVNVVRYEEDWSKFWEKHSNRDLPDVDFKKFQVVAVFTGKAVGEKPTIKNGKEGAVITVTTKGEGAGGYVIVVLDREIDAFRVLQGGEVIYER